MSFLILCFCFLCFFFFENIIDLLQPSIIYCVNWVPRLTVLDLRTDKTCECAVRIELVHM